MLLDRCGFLISLSGAELSSPLRLITEAARSGMWCQNRRFHSSCGLAIELSECLADHADGSVLRLVCF
jgi:hypothetical protein